MDFNDLIPIFEVKEKQVKACFSYYCKRLGDDEMKSVQSMTTMYAKSLADSFFKARKEQFENEQIKVEFFRYVSSLGANKSHSGYRFLEELYNLVANMKNTQDEKEID